MILVEPGSIDTDLWRGALDTADRTEARMAPAPVALYGRHIAGMRRTIPGIQKRAAPVESVAAAVQTALTAERPRAWSLVGADARLQVALRTALPTAAVDAALSRFTGGG